MYPGMFEVGVTRLVCVGRFQTTNSGSFFNSYRLCEIWTLLRDRPGRALMTTGRPDRAFACYVGHRPREAIATSSCHEATPSPSTIKDKKRTRRQFNARPAAQKEAALFKVASPSRSQIRLCLRPKITSAAPPPHPPSDRKSQKAF